MNSKHYLQVFDTSHKLAFIHTHKNAGLPYFHFIDIQGDSIIIIDYVNDYNFIESGPIIPDTVKLYKTIYNKQTYEKINEVFLKQYVRNSLETSRFKPLILNEEFSNDISTLSVETDLPVTLDRELSIALFAKVSINIKPKTPTTPPITTNTPAAQSLKNLSFLSVTSTPNILKNLYCESFAAILSLYMYTILFKIKYIGINSEKATTLEPITKVLLK